MGGQCESTLCSLLEGGLTPAHQKGPWSYKRGCLQVPRGAEASLEVGFYQQHRDRTDYCFPVLLSSLCISSCHPSTAHNNSLFLYSLAASIISPSWPSSLPWATSCLKCLFMAQQLQQLVSWHPLWWQVSRAWATYHSWVSGVLFIDILLFPLTSSSQYHVSLQYNLVRFVYNILTCQRPSSK